MSRPPSPRRGLAFQLRRLPVLLTMRRRAVWSHLVWPLLYPAGWLWRRLWRRATPVIAVTGSVGKTTTTTAVAAALGAAFDPDRGNYGSFLAAILLRHRPRRTPLVFEVGISRRGQMRRYARLLRPDVVVLTAVRGDHRVEIGSLDAIAAEKAVLAHALRPGGLLVVNGDDPRCLAIAAQAGPGVRRLTVGHAPTCDCRIAEARLAWPRTHLRIVGFAAGPATGTDEPAADPGDLPDAPAPPNVVAADLPWLGRDLARSAAFAVAVGLSRGVGHAMIGDRLAALAPIRGRLEPLPLPGGAWLIHDAWKGTWATIESALDVLEALAGWRRIAVLGDIEEPERPRGAELRRFAARAAQVAERILYLGNDYQGFRAEVLRRGTLPSAIARCRDVHAAAAALADELRPRTVILLKGRHSQKLARLVPLLRGEPVACTLTTCPARGLRCDLCPRLAGPAAGPGGEPALPKTAAAGAHDPSGTPAGKDRSP